MPDTLTKPDQVFAGTDHQVDHWFCCNNIRSLCGQELDPANFVWDMPDDNICVVCNSFKRCPNCGKVFL